MQGFSIDAISESMNKAREELLELGYETMDTFFEFDDVELVSSGVDNVSLYYLARSLEAMSRCEAVYFCTGWSECRGCRIEHAAAQQYGLKLLYQ